MGEYPLAVMIVEIDINVNTKNGAQFNLYIFAVHKQTIIIWIQEVEDSNKVKTSLFSPPHLWLCCIQVTPGAI